MTRKILCTLSLILYLTGCSFFSKKVESLVESSNIKATPLKVVKKNLHCVEDSKNQMILEDEFTLKYYRTFSNSIFESNHYSFVQKAAIMALIEMSRRPDVASPTSRLQYYLRLNGKDYFFDFNQSKLSGLLKMPFLKGVESLLKNFDKSLPLSQLANQLDTLIPKSVNVSPEFESFLQSHKNDLSKSEVLADIFFKGDEALTKHESFKRISYKKTVSDFFAKKQNNDSLYDIAQNSLAPIAYTQKNLSFKCNSDIQKENTLKDKIKNPVDSRSHYFGLKDKDNIFVAVSSSSLPKVLKHFEGSYFFYSTPSNTPVPVCQFSNDQEDIVLFSTSGRNPTQHLKHLVTYDISLVDNFPSLEELLNFSRHLFLSSPDRILYESKRGRKAQLDFFLSMNFPIYHVEALGDIIGSATFKFKNREERSLIIDDRSQARLWCSH
jgi:hypothetical protein